jgi:hypothetical protein
MPPAARPPAGKFHGSGEGVLVCIMKAFMDKQPLTGKGKTQKWEEVVKALLIEHNMKLSTAGAIEYVPTTTGSSTTTRAGRCTRATRLTTR